jgi:hypothetical protein
MCGQCQQEIAHVVPCSELAGYTQRSRIIRMNFLNPTPDGCMTGPFRTVRLPKRTWRLRQGRTALARREVWLGGRPFPNRTGPRRAGPGEACVRILTGQPGLARRLAASVGRLSQEHSARMPIKICSPVAAPSPAILICPWVFRAKRVSALSLPSARCRTAADTAVSPAFAPIWCRFERQAHRTSARQSGAMGVRLDKAT